MQRKKVASHGGDGEEVGARGQGNLIYNQLKVDRFGSGWDMELLKNQ